MCVLLISSSQKRKTSYGERRLFHCGSKEFQTAWRVGKGRERHWRWNCQLRNGWQRRCRKNKTNMHAFDGLTHMIIVILLFLAQSIHEGRIYQLKLFCDKDYPDKPPSVRFHSKIHMICVNQHTRLVEPSQLSVLANWRREYTIEKVLTELKREMAVSYNRKLPQPPEGSTFWSIWCFSGCILDFGRWFSCSGLAATQENDNQDLRTMIEADAMDGVENCNGWGLEPGYVGGCYTSMIMQKCFIV